ncbi:MAG: hypothetical protein OHK0011_01740 [Turneriella sp.]
MLDLNGDGQADFLLLRMQSEATLPPIEKVRIGSTTGQLVETKDAALERCLGNRPFQPAEVRITGCNLEIPCEDIASPGAATAEDAPRPGVLRYDCQNTEFAVVPGK